MAEHETLGGSGGGGARRYEITVTLADGTVQKFNRFPVTLPLGATIDVQEYGMCTITYTEGAGGDNQKKRAGFIRRAFAFLFRHDYQPVGQRGGYTMVSCSRCGDPNMFSDRMDFHRIYTRRGCPGRTKESAK